MYNFIRPMLRQPSPNFTAQLHENFFLPVTLESIAKAEDVWGGRFPEQLKQFYVEIGWGQLQTGINGEKADFNFIASPDELCQIHAGTSDWLMPYSQLELATIPFLQRDTDLFLCVKPLSENPNAVWWMWGQNLPNGGKICDSLIEFFKRLIEDPNWFNPASNS